jgi:hypothetical protein
MILAIEDSLSETLMQRVLGEIAPGVPFTTVGRTGREHLRKRARELNRAAQSVPVVMLIDLDRRVPCAFDLMQEFLGTPKNPRLIFRVAVMEIESWILADRDAFAEFLRIPAHRIPAVTDEIDQPKEFVVNLARKSRSKQIYEDLVPAAGSTATVGPAFNSRVGEFVRGGWSSSRAAQSSPSLLRALSRIREAFG